MHIYKRDGRIEKVDLNKIINRIKRLIDGYGDNNDDIIGEKLDIDPMIVSLKVCGKLIDNMTTDQLDMYTAEICHFMIGEHYHYGLLANRLIISGHHKNTKSYAKFSDITSSLYKENLLDSKYYNYIMENADILDKAINHNNDYNILNYTAMKSLLKSYFLKPNNKNNNSINKHCIERYQHLLMRQSVAIHLGNIENIITCYKMMSEGLFTHASPTMYNSGTHIQQMSSCFLLGVHDSMDGMYTTLRDCGHISKMSGGIGINAHSIRATGSYINGTNSTSSGIIPFIKVLNESATHISQGHRKGSIAIYLEPWHADIMNFIEAKLNTGAPELRARDLFYGLWIPDIFMRRVNEALEYKQESGCSTEENPVMWSLMCPKECPLLLNKYGEEFENEYINYENNGKYRQRIPVLMVWDAIVKSQIETGTPYMCYKDSVNRKNNQKNIGVINSSNLCTEIMEYSDHEEYGTCNLASINLKIMVNTDDKNNIFFDFHKLEKVAYQLCVNLNNVIDINYYPVKESSRSNFRHRPIGIGIQGLAETFIRMGLEFSSNEAKVLNRNIFKVIYYGALRASCDLSKARTEMLILVPENIRKELKTLSSNIEYYNNYLNRYQLDNRSNSTIGEINEYNRICKSVNNDIKNINNIIEKYGLNPNYTEYMYMSDNEQYLGAYSTFIGSPAYYGQLQYDMWFEEAKNNGKMDDKKISEILADYEDKFNVLKGDIKKYGLRNSLLTTIMPTASTSLLLNNTECIEPIAHCIYVKNTIGGSDIIYNSELLRILHENKIWNMYIKEKILENNGNISTINEIPLNIRKLFTTAFELPNKPLIDMAYDRSPFIDQSQSLNHFVSDINKINSIHMYTFKCGLKTGSYYIRTRPKVDPIKFSLDTQNNQNNQNNQSNSNNTSPSNSINGNIPLCRRDNPNCESCSA